MKVPSLPELHAALVAAGQASGFRRVDPGGDPAACCLGFVREGSLGAGSIYLSAGIHGDEPAGPLALLGLLQENRFPAEIGVVIFPLLNPEGFAVGSRTNRFGVDVNRDYRRLAAAETQRHLACLKRLGRFEAAVCLHEDWEAGGFYLYEVLGPGLDSWAERIFAVTDPHVLRERSPSIDGHFAEGGRIAYAAEDVTREERPDWPEAFYLIARHTDRCYTLETPSSAALTARVKAQQAAVFAICHLERSKVQR